MDFDFTDFYKLLEREVRSGGDFSGSLGAVLGWCAEVKPHPDWAKLCALDMTKEVANARRWLAGVAAKDPCPFPVRGAYFGLAEYMAKGVEYARLYPGFMSTYDGADAEKKWVWKNPRHYPRKAFFSSKALKEGGIICGGDEGLGTHGLIAFSVSFAALLLRHALDGEAYRTLRGTGAIGVVTGYDSGDLLRLGEITSSGFQPNPGAMI